MIRWEEQESGEWLGYSGQVVVATAKPQNGSGSERWDWEVAGAGRLKGARNSGHRTNELDARRAADAFWQRWLEATALRPDVQRLAQESLPKRSGRNQRPRPGPAPVVHKAEALTKAADEKLGAMQARLDAAERRARDAEERARASEHRAASAEKAVAERIAKLKKAVAD
jgi:hypothetical protein